MEKRFDKYRKFYYDKNMKKINRNIKKINVLLRKDVGLRFLLFRKAIKRTLPQMAAELKSSQEDIAAIEKGTAYPKVNYLHYLHEKYGLNLNWLLGNIGEMFIQGSPQGLDVNPNFVLALPPASDNARTEEYHELMQLLRIPVIEKTMLAKLQELKERLKEEE